MKPTSESGTRPAVKSVRARPLTDGHPKASGTTSTSTPPVEAASQAGASTSADRRELPALTLRPPPEVTLGLEQGKTTHEIAPPPIVTASPPVFGVPALAPPPSIQVAVPNATETFRPSEVDRPMSLAPKRGRARFVQAAAAVTVLALSGTAWLKLRARAQHAAKPVAVTAKAAPERAPAIVTPAPTLAAAAQAEPAAPAPSAAPGPAVSTAAPAPSTDLASAFAAALSGATPSANAVTVTVRVKPAGSIIFEHGKRLGTDVVQVNVEPGGKKNLVALLDGYLPKRFSVDGSLNSVTLALRPQGLPAPAEPATYGTPSPPPAEASPNPGAAPAPAAPAAAPRAATPTPPKAGSPAKKEAFDPSRDVGSL